MQLMTDTFLKHCSKCLEKLAILLIYILRSAYGDETSHGSGENDIKPHSSGHDPTQTGSLQSLFRHMMVFHEAIKVMQLLSLSNTKKTSATKHTLTVSVTVTVTHSQEVYC